MGKVIITALGGIEDSIEGPVLNIEPEVITTQDEVEHAAIIKGILDQVSTEDIQTTTIEVEPDTLPDVDERVTVVVLHRHIDSVAAPVEATFQQFLLKVLVEAPSTPDEEVTILSAISSLDTPPAEDLVTEHEGVMESEDTFHTPTDLPEHEGAITHRDVLQAVVDSSSTSGVRLHLDTITFSDLLGRANITTTSVDVPGVSDPELRTQDGDETFLLVEVGREDIDAAVERLQHEGFTVSSDAVDAPEDQRPTHVLLVPTETPGLDGLVLHDGILSTTDALAAPVGVIDLRGTTDVLTTVPSPAEEQESSSTTTQEDEPATPTEPLLEAEGTILSTDEDDVADVVESHDIEQEPEPVATTSLLAAVLGTTTLLSSPTTPSEAQESEATTSTTDPVQQAQEPTVESVGTSTQEDGTSTPAVPEESTADFFSGTAISEVFRKGPLEWLATPTPGTPRRIFINQDGVGRSETEGYTDAPSQNVDELVYLFYVSEALTNDNVRLGYEVPHPNFVENWHFGIDLSGWTEEDPNDNVDWTWTAEDGDRSSGCVEVSTGTTSTGDDELRQQVTGLPTDTGRRIVIGFSHVNENPTLGAAAVELRIYEDSGGSPGTLIHSVNASNNDSSWTRRTAEGDASGNLDFTIADNVDTVWVALFINDTSSLNAATRRLDDVTLRVDTGLSTIAPTTLQSFGAGDDPFHIGEDDLRGPTDDTNATNLGWVFEDVDGTTPVLFYEQRGGGDQMRAFSSSGTKSGIWRRPFTNIVTKGVLRVRNLESVNDATETAVFAIAENSDGTGQTVRLEFHDGAITVTDANRTDQQIGAYTLDGATGNTDIDVQFIMSGGGTVRILVFDDVAGTLSVDDNAAPISQIGAVRVGGLDLSGNSDGIRFWTFDGPMRFGSIADSALRIDVSGDNITQEMTERLITWVEHEDNGDGVEVYADAVGLGYTVSS